MKIGKIVLKSGIYLHVLWFSPAYAQYRGVYTLRQIEEKFTIKKGFIYENRV